MSFLFASSHLPAHRSLRPAIANEEEEEEHEDFQSLPRSGTVRAISHLPEEPPPVRMEVSAPQPTRKTDGPSWPPGPETATSHDGEQTHAPEAPEALMRFDDDTHEDPQAHEPDDSRPWYLPRLTHEDLQAHGGDGDEDLQANEKRNHPALSIPHDASSSSDSRPSLRNLYDVSHIPASDTSTGEAPAQDTPSAQPQGLLFERRQPSGLRSQDIGMSRNLPDLRGAPFKTLAATSSSQQQSRSHQQDRLGAPHQTPTGAAQQNPVPGAPPTASGGNPGSSALQEHNRVRQLDEKHPGAPPKQRIDSTSTKNKPREQYDREKSEYEKAKAAYEANHEANERNKQTLKAWENYDRAIQLMENAPEGKKVLDHLRNDKSRVFKVVMVNDPVKDSFMGIRIKEGAQGQYVNTGKKDEMGREIHVLFLNKSALEGSTLRPDGSINPDAEALEKVWHELYHAYERHTSGSGGVDPLGVGTGRDSDKNPDDPTISNPQAHERRAVRFENIIRARNKGTRMKNKYGGSYYTDKFGRTHEIPPIDVPDAQPLFLH